MGKVAGGEVVMDPSQVVAIATGIIGGGAAIIAAILAGIFGLRTYPSQKRLDLKEQRRKDRETAYSNLLTAYAETERWYGVQGQESKFAEAFLKYSQAYSALFNVADNNVLTPASEFHGFVWVRTPKQRMSDADWAAGWRERYAKMLFEMRADAFVSDSDVTEDDIRERLPWYVSWDTEEKAQQRLA